MNRVRLAIASRPLLFAGAALAVLLVILFVMHRRKQQAIDAADNQASENIAAAAPTAPAYFGSDGISNVLSDYPGMFGTANSVGTAGGDSSDGITDTNNLSPSLDSTAGVDISTPAPPVSTGGGAPVTTTDVHGVKTTTVIDSNGNVHKVPTGILNDHPGQTVRPTNVSRGFRTQGSGHPAVSNAPARNRDLHSAGLIGPQKATPARRRHK